MIHNMIPGDCKLNDALADMVRYLKHRFDNIYSKDFKYECMLFKLSSYGHDRVKPWNALRMEIGDFECIIDLDWKTVEAQSKHLDVGEWELMLADCVNVLSMKSRRKGLNLLQ